LQALAKVAERNTMLHTRRDIGKLALAGLPALRAFGAPALNSTIKGVKIGVITYSFRGGINTIDDIIAAITKIGLSEVELMSASAETEAGAPSAGRGGAPGQGGMGMQGRGRAGAGAQPGQGPAGAMQARGQGAPDPAVAPQLPAPRPPMTEEQIAAARQQPSAVALRDWRLSVPMAKYQAIGKRFKDAGINLGILCFNMNEAITEDEMDYAFRMAKALGAKAISSSTQVTVAKRVAPIAEKHKMMIGFHGHDNNTDPNETGSLESYARALSYGKYNAVNLDIGHFTSCNYDAIDFIKKNYARITNLHIKDRKKNHGPNMVWGEGDTPIKEVLDLLVKEKYPFPANIELEYRIPAGSDSVAETIKCYDFCKKALA
jgi:sugar phosphate isomerase/epimerase